MEDKQLQEFDLEDIIREFSDAPQTPAEEESAVQTPEEVIAEKMAEEDNEETTEGSALLPEADDAEESRKSEEPQPAVVTDATIRLDKIPDTHGTVRNAQRIDDENEVRLFTPEQEEKTEPFSEQWEPEYEQPIAEYVPPRPIAFHPKSRLRELKKKLVAGPEKLYYILSEKGLGKVQAAIFFSVLVVLLSAGATAMYAVGWLPESRMKLMVFGQLLAMLVSALLGCYQLLEGAVDLLRKRFSLNTLLVFTFIFCCVDGVLCLQQLRVPCCAAFSLQVTMSLWNSYQKRNTKLGKLDTMRKATRLDSVAVVEDYYDGEKGILRGEGQVEHFMDTLDQPARQEKVLNVYVLVSLLVSVAVGAVAGVLKGLGGGVFAGISAGVQVAAVTTIAAMPASMFITISRPMAVLERRHHALGTVLCGWQGVEALSGKAVMPLEHEDLLPAGTVKMNGVKFFGSRQPDEIIAYAAALIGVNGGSLEPLFTHLLDSRNGMHYVAESVIAYENGGLGGVVNGEDVLVGSMSFLKEMNVEVPEGIRVNNAVCTAVDGELCGLFAVTYEKSRTSAAGMVTLCGYRGLKPVLISSDFVLTEKFIRSQFEVNTKRILFPEHSVRTELRDKKLEPEHCAAALVTGEGLASVAYAVTGARTLKNAATAGVAVHMTGGILGMAMMLVLVILGRLDLLTPASMFLYELIWMIPGLLITEWTRTI